MHGLWHRAGCAALASLLRPVFVPGPARPAGPEWAVDGLGGTHAHATPADGRVRLVSIRAAAVVDRLMMLAAP
jgi:hypothetical protein